MDLQSLFYIVAIVCMILWIVILILLAIILWTIQNFVKNAPKKMEEAVTSIINKNKSGLAGMAGMAIMSFIASKAKRWFSKG